MENFSFEKKRDKFNFFLTQGITSAFKNIVNFRCLAARVQVQCKLVTLLFLFSFLFWNAKYFSVEQSVTKIEFLASSVEPILTISMMSFCGLQGSLKSLKILVAVLLWLC